MSNQDVDAAGHNIVPSMRRDSISVFHSNLCIRVANGSNY
jgi:hypothetical protein